ncbi:hypothetical protein QBC37DRAFT_329282 [Rhypophila decipiens]|uniref:Uncharacterized protein n=1 Tax=Rhypophila decipiens TaxID=261697 RepID=A0AAN6XV71_9PEZI|nr:hypothetical protein QBC37DRAFT_329282 [Rhypophila decipiens]
MSCNPNITVDTLACSVDCANRPCQVQANGDIGGIGVILGFAITAWLVVGLVIAYYVMVYDCSLDAFRGKDDFETVAAEPNPVDRVFLSAVRKWQFLDYSQATVETKKNINKICNKCVVGFADIQIMTGIAILISGIRPTICGLQAYHWQIIVHLAWFSSITHLSALSFLRHYLINRRREYYIRGILMAVLAGLLAVAVGFTGHFDWDRPDSGGRVAPSDFARCVFIGKMDHGTLAFESMIFDLLLIGYGYTIRLLKTWKKANNWPVTASKYLRESSSSKLQDWRPGDKSRTARLYLLTNFLRPLNIALLRVLYIQLNIFTSYLTEVFWLIISSIWRTMRLARLIQQYRPSLENDWTFGQILPMIMMAAPLILLSAPITSLCPGSISVPGRRESVPRIRPESEVITLDDASRQPEDENARFLESSPALQGAALLVALPYVQLGVYLLVNDRKGLVRPVRELAVSLLVFNPLLQVLWVTYTIWVARIPLVSRIPEDRSSLNFTVFVTFVAACLVEFSQTIYSSGPAIGLVLFAYSTLTIWAQVSTSGLRGLRGERFRLTLRWVVSLVLLGGSISQVPLSFFIPLPFFIYCLSIFFSGWLMTRWRKFIHPRSAAFLVILGVILAINIQGWGTIWIYYPFFNPLQDFSLWILDWAIIIFLWPVARRFGWVHV